MFLFLHSYHVHDPYRAPVPFKKAFTDRRSEQFRKQEGYPAMTSDLTVHLPQPSPGQLDEIMGFYDNGSETPSPDKAIYSEVANERFAIRGIRRNGWLLVWHGAAERVELYDVSAQHPEVVEQMHDDLQSWMEELLRSSQNLQAVPMDADGLNLMEFEQSVLRELGYIKEGPRSQPHVEPSPRLQLPPQGSRSPAPARAPRGGARRPRRSPAWDRRS